MFFSQFPKTLYSFDLSGASPTAVTNIFSRFSFNDSVLNNAFAFYKYQIREGDTPEIVAATQYGDPKMHWVICLTNNLSDPQFDFPLQQSSLEKSIVLKYGYPSIANAYSDIHHYEYRVKKVLSEVNGPTTETNEVSTVTLEQYNYTANTIQTQPINSPVTQTINFYANNANANSGIVSTLTITSEYRPVYVYDYENEVNESKREIKILKREYVSSLAGELERVLNG